VISQKGVYIIQRQIKVNQAANTVFLSAVLLVAVFTFSLSAQSHENASVADLLPETIAPINAPFEMPRFKQPTFPDRTFNIKDFGAAEGGKIKVTDAIRKTIEATANGDGVNPDSCKNVLIEYCDMDTGDDCFAIKSGRAEDGLRVGRPCENIVIRHNQGRRGHGGVVIGSETSGGIRNVFIRNCTFNGTDRGLRFKTARGRGAVIENIWARNITMGTIRKEAIIVNTLRYTDRYPAHPVSDRTPTYRNLHFQNITCEYSKGTCIRIVGLPEKPMRDLTLRK